MDALTADIHRLEQAMRTLFQAMKQPSRWTQMAAQAGVTIDRPAAQILHVLRTNGSCGVQELAQLLGIEAPSVTRKTQELERLGYLERSPSPRDRRAVELHITTAGSHVSKRIYAVQQQAINQALAGWQPADRARFVRLFERFADDVNAIYNTET